jgi:hypothetical protein
VVEVGETLKVVEVPVRPMFAVTKVGVPEQSAAVFM